MGPGFRFLLIAIVLRGSFASSKCPTYTSDQDNLIYKVGTIVTDYDTQYCKDGYWPKMLEKLYNKYQVLAKKSMQQDKVIGKFKSHREKDKELIKLNTQKIKYLQAEIQRLRAAIPNTVLPNKDLTPNQSKGIISNLRVQLESCNSTYYENYELKKQLQSKTEEVQDFQEIWKQPTKEKINPPSYLMEVSKTSSCSNFTNTTGIRPFEFTWQGKDRAFCDRQLKGPGWMVIQRRTDGNTDFYLNWSDYRNGFGDLAGEYFIGLENLHQLTSKLAPCELLIQLKDFEGETRFARYDNFEVGDEKSSYQLKSLGQYSGDAGNALSYNLRSKFSTFDRDSPDECAQKTEGAWWYSEMCGFSNLNGKYPTLANLDFENIGTGIFWHDVEWHEFDYSMQSVQMMIRSKEN